MTPQNLTPETIGTMIQIAITLGGFVVLFLRVKWQGEQNSNAIEKNAEGIRNLGERLRADHKALGAEQKAMSESIGGKIDILFSKSANAEKAIAVTDSTVTQLIPQVHRNRDHIDAIGARVGIGRQA